MERHSSPAFLRRLSGVRERTGLLCALTQQYTQDKERTEGLRHSVQHHDDSPEHDVDAEILAEPGPLRDVHGREDPDEEP